MIVTRWKQGERALASREVDGYFEEVRDRIVLFAFETVRLTVGRHTGNCSVKFVTRGRERYEIGGSRQAVLEPGRLLLVNAGQDYASAVEGVETRAVSFFLPDAEVRAALAALAARHRRLLDTPSLEGPCPEVRQVPFRTSAEATAARRALCDALSPADVDRDVVRERVHLLTLHALADNLGLARPCALSSVRRPSTRDELVARVLRARERIEDLHGRGIRLDDLADTACLSRYHFLRVFADVFGETPMACARRVRIARAAERLRGGQDAGLVARSAGYSSASALRRAVAAQQRVSDRKPPAAAF
jgi:AraC family transcriptional regulator